MRVLLLFSLCLLMLQGAQAQTPRRVMVLVFDQMRAEYIERFDLSNFKRAQKMGVNFDHGFVGHLESNTIISHPVISTGNLPRNLPWSAQVSKDTEGRLGAKDDFYSPALLKPEQWMTLLQTTCGDSSILARLKRVNDGPTFAVAQKEYAAYTYGGPYCETIIALGSAFKTGEFKGYHSVAGVNVPSYIREPIGNRFYLEAKYKWGSEVERYSLKGSGYISGRDPNREGGDAWVGDVVAKIMTEEPEWAAILASFGATDKVSHVLAEHDGPTQAQWAKAYGINLQDTLHKADAQLGRILDRLESQDLLKETALVITADHGGQKNSVFHGRNVPGRHGHDQNFGRAINFDYTSDPNPHLKPLIDTGWLEMVTMDTMGLFWTSPLDSGQRSQFARLASEMPGVAEVFGKTPEGNYERLFRSSKLKGAQLSWAQRNHRQLANTLGGPSGPDFVSFFFDSNGYALIGAHGGAQELVQRIPMIVISPNLARRGARSTAPMRLVDVNPVLGRLLELPDHKGLDGTCSPIRPFLERPEQP